MREAEVRGYLLGLTPDTRSRLKKHYVKLIAVNTGNLIEYNRKGKPINQKLMWWMVPAWEMGLKELNDIMKELNEE